MIFALILTVILMYFLYRMFVKGQLVQEDTQYSNVVKTGNLRKVYSNLFVLAKIKEMAKKNGIDLEKELNSIDVLEIDGVIENEISQGLKKSLEKTKK